MYGQHQRRPQLDRYISRPIIINNEDDQDDEKKSLQLMNESNRDYHPIMNMMKQPRISTTTTTKEETTTEIKTTMALNNKNRSSSVLLLSCDSDGSTSRKKLALVAPPKTSTATTKFMTKKNYNNHHNHNHPHHHHHHHEIKTYRKKTQKNNMNSLLWPANNNTKTTMVLPTLTKYFLLALLATAAALLLFTSSIVVVVEAIKLQPEGREKFYWSGEQFVITCQNTNNIKNVKIRWIGPNGLDITEDRSQRVHAESTGPHGHRLVVMNATAPDDDGQYKCTIGSADDRNPREHIEFNLKIHKQTSFKDTPRHLVLKAGQSGTLSCHVEFDQAALSTGVVSWVRDQRPIEMFNDSTYTVTDYDPNKQLSQLIISPLTKQHDGVYTCRAMAETSKLSKISDFDIRLETNYAPTFDIDTQTVWVERHRSFPSSSSARNSLEQQQVATARQQQQANFYPNGVPRNSAHQPGGRNRHNRPGYSGSAINSRDNSAELATTTTNSSGNNIVQVELRCTCQANPPASILWTTQNSNYILAKGEPVHVLEQPRVEIDGQNTTSILLIGYNLDQDWQFKRDSYICSASNKLGKASKTYTIEQGDPPPAFNVGPNRQYNPETWLFKFTLLGPIYDQSSEQLSANNRSQQQQQPSSMHSSSQRHEIVPPVDSFRIRAEIPNDQSSSSSSSPSSSSSSSSSSPFSSLSSSSSSEPKSSYSSSSRRLFQSNSMNQQQQQRQLEPPSVQWSLDQALSYQSNGLIVPQNFTVNLGKLPSGNQRLFLEAHNAVGWSPESTYLGEYYIVSGANSISMAPILLLPLLSGLVASFYLLIAINKNNKWL